MTPYRICVSAVGFRRGRLYKGRGPTHKGAYSAITPAAYGYVAWNPDHTVETSRLPSSGTFLWPGLHAVRAAAYAELQRAVVQQVSIRTNQDRTVYMYNKYADGRIRGYAPIA